MQFTKLRHVASCNLLPKPSLKLFSEFKPNVKFAMLFQENFNKEEKQNLKKKFRFGSENFGSSFIQRGDT